MTKIVGIERLDETTVCAGHGDNWHMTWAAYTTLDVPGATGTFAYGIDGGNIVGYYVDANGDAHGFINTIPEPATLSLLALGMLLAGRRR